MHVVRHQENAVDPNRRTKKFKEDVVGRSGSYLYIKKESNSIREKSEMTIVKKENYVKKFGRNEINEKNKQTEEKRNKKNGSAP